MLNVKHQSENSRTDANPTPKNPQTWWQWLLLYPTLVATLLSSIPTCVEPKSVAVSLLSKAYAAQPALPLQMDQADDTVICQRLIDKGRILRRIAIRSGWSGCYDKIVNYTGEVLRKKPAPCDPKC